MVNKVVLACLGGEKGKCLSYKNNQLSLQEMNKSLIENQFLMNFVNLAENKVTLLCLGLSDVYLSHKNGQLAFMQGFPTENETFTIKNLEYSVAFECCGPQKGKYISHCFSKAGLQNGNQGLGEVFDLHII
jgi:hypothetical protein